MDTESACYVLKNMYTYLPSEIDDARVFLEFILVMDASPLANKNNSGNGSLLIEGMFETGYLQSPESSSNSALCVSWPCPVLPVYPRKLATCTGSLGSDPPNKL